MGDVVSCQSRTESMNQLTCHKKPTTPNLQVAGCSSFLSTLHFSWTNSPSATGFPAPPRDFSGGGHQGTIPQTKKRSIFKASKVVDKTCLRSFGAFHGWKASPIPVKRKPAVITRAGDVHKTLEKTKKMPGIQAPGVFCGDTRAQNQWDLAFPVQKISLRVRWTGPNLFGGTYITGWYLYHMNHLPSGKMIAMEGFFHFYMSFPLG